MRVMWMAAGMLMAGVAGGSPVPKPAPATDPVSGAIRGDATCELGKAPKITVTLTNNTRDDIHLVGSLDASDCRWRYPHCYFEVTGPDGKPVEPKIARCGNANPLRVRDFVKVPAGGAFDPYQSIDSGGFFPAHQLSPRTFSKAGEYRVRFVYSSKIDDLAKWGGKGGGAATDHDEIKGLFKLVPKVEVRSDEFKLTVVEPGK